jgi:DNA repair protein RecN (Recombination protein N)
LEIFSRNLEVRPERLEWVEDRLNDLAKIKRKYGLSLEDLMGRGRRLAEILDRLDGAGLERARLVRAKEAALALALEAAGRLSRARREAAERLVSRLTAALRPLGFPKMAMEVDLEAPDDQAGRLGPAGFDRVDFLFSPNPGEGRASLGRIASGGELSRVLLALKTVENRPGDQMLVFDEIDAGLGGAAAEAVAGSLAELAGRRQLVIITHLPRVAALAGRHFRVTKGLAGDQGRTVTAIIPLEPGERVDELARMLGGPTPARRRRPWPGNCWAAEARAFLKSGPACFEIEIMYNRSGSVCWLAESSILNIQKFVNRRSRFTRQSQRDLNVRLGRTFKSVDAPANEGHARERP